VHKYKNNLHKYKKCLIIALMKVEEQFTRIKGGF
jgi:hypothetical protein